MKKFRLVSLILTASIFLTGMTYPPAGSGNPMAAATYDPNAGKDIYIIEEDISKRGEFEKHYYCSDGSFIAVSYPEAIHYYKIETLR